MTRRPAVLHFLTAILSLLIISCAGTSVQSPEESATVDAPLQIRMEPAWLYYSPIKFALLKNDSMKQHEVLLTVIVKGEHTFKTGESLHFTIDGDNADFNSSDILTKTEMSPGFFDGDTYIAASWWSSKTYMIDKDVMKRLIYADEVKVKVDLRNGFVEGIFSRDEPHLARPAFREFYKKIDALPQ